MFKSNTTRVLLGLALGLAGGAACQAWGGPSVRSFAEGVGAVGGLWLNALRMTVVPLVFALLVTGIASVADAAATGRLAVRAIAMFAVLLVVACLYTIASTLGLLALWPVSAHDAAALIAGAKGSGAVTAAAQPGFAEWLQGLVPTNPIKSAAEDAILPLVVFGTFFGFAATRLEPDLRLQIVGLFKAIGDIMITIVEWVLVAAPLGVFALSLGVGLRAGFGAAAVLGHYIVVVSAACIGITLVVYAVVAASRRLPLGRFARAAVPVQAVAIGTQSSLATLPAMVEQAREALGVPERIVGLVLPLAVAVFRITSPVANLAVAFFVAAVYGLHPNLLQIMSAILVALAVSVGTVGLPGQVSFFASIAPICLTLAVPIDLLPILIAVEVVPDLFRTIGNVTADLAVTAMLKPREGEPRPAEVVAG